MKSCDSDDESPDTGPPAPGGPPRGPGSTADACETRTTSTETLERSTTNIRPRNETRRALRCEILTFPSTKQRTSAWRPRLAIGLLHQLQCGGDPVDCSLGDQTPREMRDHSEHMEEQLAGSRVGVDPYP